MKPPGLRPRATLFVLAAALVACLPRACRAEAPKQEAPAEDTTCQVCGEKCESSGELKAHLAIKHGETVPVFVPTLKALAATPDADAIRGHFDLWVGAAYLYAHKPDKALPLLESAAEALPQSAEAQAHLSRALDATGEKDKAKTHADKARELDAEVTFDGSLVQGREYTFVPRSYVVNLRAKHAGSQGDEVPKPLLAELQAWLAGYYYDLRKAEEAIKSAQQATTLDPENPRARALLGLMAAESGACAQAVIQVRGALEIDSNDQWVQQACLRVAWLCRVDVLPPQILLISPLEGQPITPRTDLSLVIRDNSGVGCTITVSKILASGRPRLLKQFTAKGPVKLSYRDLKWSLRGENLIEIIAKDVHKNTGRLRLTFKAD